MNKQRELLQKVFDNIRSADLMLAGVYDEIVEELAKPEQEPVKLETINPVNECTTESRP